MQRYARTTLLALLSAMPLTAAHAAPATCPTPPPGQRDLDTPPYYLRPDASAEERARRARRDVIMQPFATFLTRVVTDADRWHARLDRDAGLCAVRWLDRWARDGAWTGTMATTQAEYERKWDVAGYALAYLKVRKLASTEEHARVARWLVDLADRSLAFFERSGQERNNHWYWTGLAVGAVALAAGDARLWALARDMMADAARDVDATGMLPREVKRGPRALSYHGFSVMPIVLLAELGAARGEDWYAIDGGAVHRLVATFLSGLNDPSPFAARAGVAQEPNPGTGSGWLWLYRRRFPDRLPAGLPATPRGHRWIGGDAPILGDVLGRLR